MHPSKRNFILLNILGGSAVLSSYAWGLMANPDLRGDFWGDVPKTMQPLYTVSMLAATAGYFAFFSYILARMDPATTRIGGRSIFTVLNVVFLGILIPSALWMPLTFEMLSAPSPGLWAAIRLVLGLVGVSSIGLITVLWSAEAAAAPIHRWVAIAGATAFAWQTAVLDGLVWPAYFPH